MKVGFPLNPLVILKKKVGKRLLRSFGSTESLLVAWRV
jgi:hypothetical protein